MTGSVVEILGVPVACLDTASALAAVERLHDDPDPQFLFYANAHTLHLAALDPDYKRLLRSAALVLNDGIGMSLAARMHGVRFPANLNGSDFNPLILELAARRGWGVFLLGARRGVAERAAHRLSRRIPDLRVVGTHHGYLTPADDGCVVEAIRASRATVVMVGMGNPIQEYWLERNLRATGARLGIGVGAFFDFSAGTVRRAPHWMNRAGLEWVYRVALEPRRLWRRYLIGTPSFLTRVAWDRLTAVRGRDRRDEWVTPPHARALAAGSVGVHRARSRRRRATRPARGRRDAPSLRRPGPGRR